MYQRRTWDEFKKVLSVFHASQPVERAENLEYRNPLSGVCWDAVYSSTHTAYKCYGNLAKTTNEGVSNFVIICSKTWKMTLSPLLIFNDWATFHLSRKVNRHNVRIWGRQNPQEALEHEMDSRKLICFMLYRKQRFFFAENKVTGVRYLAMLQNGFFLKWVKIQKTSFSNRTELHPIRTGMFDVFWMNLYFKDREVASRRKKTWRSSSGPRDLLISHPANLFVGVRKRNSLCTISTNNFVRPKKRIATAVNSVMQDILLRVWKEFTYRLDVTRAAGGGHIEHL